MNIVSKGTNNYKVKDVRLCDHKIEALIDCRCQLNFLRQDIYESINGLKLHKTDIILTLFLHEIF